MNNNIVAHMLREGDILVAGDRKTRRTYFYQILELQNSRQVLKLRQVNANDVSVADGPTHQQRLEAIPGDFTGNSFRRRIFKDRKDQVYVAIVGKAAAVELRAIAWNGEPQSTLN